MFCGFSSRPVAGSAGSYECHSSAGYTTLEEMNTSMSAHHAAYEPSRLPALASWRTKYPGGLKLVN
jgi:hypothetical protein